MNKNKISLAKLYQLIHYSSISTNVIQNYAKNLQAFNVQYLMHPDLMKNANADACHNREATSVNIKNDEGTIEAKNTQDTLYTSNFSNFSNFTNTPYSTNSINTTQNAHIKNASNENHASHTLNSLSAEQVISILKLYKPNFDSLPFRIWYWNCICLQRMYASNVIRNCEEIEHNSHNQMIEKETNCDSRALKNSAKSNHISNETMKYRGNSEQGNYRNHNEDRELRGKEHQDIWNQYATTRWNQDIIGDCFRNKNLWLEQYGLGPLLLHSGGSLLRMFIELEMDLDRNEIPKIPHTTELNITQFNGMNSHNLSSSGTPDEKLNLILTACKRYDSLWDKQDHSFYSEYFSNFIEHDNVDQMIDKQEETPNHFANKAIRPLVSPVTNNLHQPDFFSFLDGMEITTEEDLEGAISDFINRFQQLPRLSQNVKQSLSIRTKIPVTVITNTLRKMRRRILQRQSISRDQLHQIEYMLAMTSFQQPSATTMHQLQQDLQLSRSTLSIICRQIIQKHYIHQIQTVHRKLFLHLRSAYLAGKVSEELISQHAKTWQVPPSILRRLLVVPSRKKLSKIDIDIIRDCILGLGLHQKEQLDSEDISNIYTALQETFYTQPNVRISTSTSKSRKLVDDEHSKNILVENVVPNQKIANHSNKGISEAQIRRIHKHTRSNSPLTLIQRMKIENFILVNKIFDMDRLNSMTDLQIQTLRQTVRGSEKDIRHYISQLLHQ